MKNLSGKLLLLTLSSTLLMAACTTKKRDQAWVQGQGVNMEAIADFDGKRFKLQTLDPVGGSNAETMKTTMAPDKVSVKSQVKDKDKTINTMFLPVVNYKTEADLLGSTPIKGRPNFGGYEIVYRINDAFLVVYKIGDIKDIPLDEQTYAEKEADGRLAIPLIGFPVQFVGAERVLNERDEATNKLVEKKELKKAGSTYFRFDRNGGILFKAAATASIFPKELFNDEWYYTETIVAAPIHQKVALGADLQSTTRVKFSLTQNALKVINLNLDERLDIKDDVNLQTALTAEITWQSFRTKNKGTTKEKDLEQELDPTKGWTNSEFVTVNFDSAITEVSSTPGKVVELEVTDDYLGFTIFNQEHNKRIRYSFLRAKNRNYTPKIYHEKDQEKFGFFDTAKSTLVNYEIRRKEDLAKNVFINRFNPQLKNPETGAREIVYHFTDTSPKCTAKENNEKICFREAVKVAVANWDRAFKLADTGITIRLDEEKDVKLGDLRYNTINLIDTLLEGNVFGFGPSTADPYTGEIISATTNMHVTPTRSRLFEEVRMYIRQELGLLKDNYYFDNDRFKSLGMFTSGAAAYDTQIFAEQSAMKSKQNSQSNARASDGKSLLSKKARIFVPDEKTGKLKSVEKEFRISEKNFGLEYDLSLSSANIHQDIKTLCPEVDNYVQQIKTTNQNLQNAKDRKYFNDNELEILQTCSRKMVMTRITTTVVHELGHNFGLRHNFKGSIDKDNFFPADSNGRRSHTSSVMEYVSSNEDSMVTPGMYDIAAIRFGYADSVAQVEKQADGTVKTLKSLKLDPKRTIDENIASSKENIAPNRYQYCEDYAARFTQEDPLCRPEDTGTTAVEAVEFYIKKFNSEVATENFRFDNLKMPSVAGLQSYRYRMIFSPMKEIYNKWRTIVASKVGLENKYLERYSKEEYEIELEKFARQGKKEEQEEFADYRKASELIFNFLYRVVNMPVRYCIAENSEKKIELIELETIRREFGLLSRTSISSCSDQVVIESIKNKGLTYLNEMGHFLNTLRYEFSAEASKEIPDVIGSIYDRSLALDMMTSRDAESILLYQNGFFPSMMDEPGRREAVVAMTMYRIIEGLNPKILEENAKKKLPLRPNLLSELAESSKKFSVEHEFLALMINLTIKGLSVPEKPSVTMARRQEFQGFLTASQVTTDRAVVVAEIGGGMNFVVLDKNSKYAIQIANQFNKLKQMRSISDPNVISKTAEAQTAFVNVLPGKAESSSKMTLSQMNKAVLALQEKFNSESNPTTKQMVKPILDKISEFANQFIGGIVRAKKDELMKKMSSEMAVRFSEEKMTEEDQSEFAKILEQVGGQIEIVSAFGIKDNVVLPFFRDAWITMIQSTKQNAEKSYFEYKKNKKDLDSQLDLLLTFMNSAGSA
jgi:hypothetical protein